MVCLVIARNRWVWHRKVKPSIVWQVIRNILIRPANACPYHGGHVHTKCGGHNVQTDNPYRDPPELLNRMFIRRIRRTSVWDALSMMMLVDVPINITPVHEAMHREIEDVMQD